MNTNRAGGAGRSAETRYGGRAGAARSGGTDGRRRLRCPEGGCWCPPATSSCRAGPLCSSEHTPLHIQAVEQELAVLTFIYLIRAVRQRVPGEAGLPGNVMQERGQHRRGGGWLPVHERCQHDHAQAQLFIAVLLHGGAALSTWNK